MNINNVGFTFVTFGTTSYGKKRPVLITSTDDQSIQFFSITSQYEKKSEAIKKQYYPIEDWKEIGLSKKSWIDIGSLNRAAREDIQFEYVGDLTNRDLNGLAEFIENFRASKS